jgi:hypothetical protein
LPGHALARDSSSDASKAGTLRSPGVLLRPDHHYYGPLGLPLRTARLRPRLIRVGSPRPRQRRRASRVPCSSFRTCHSPYPAETRCALRIQRPGHGLRRDMSGSALRLFM